MNKSTPTITEKKRFEIIIKVEKTLLMFADSEEQARGKIQEYVNENEGNIETISVKKVKSFFHE